jgi:hypothetical protein
LPEGFVEGKMTIESPGLLPESWLVAVLHTTAVLARVGTLGASWTVYEPEDRVQLWLPGNVVVPAGVMVEIELAEGQGHG